MSALPVVRGVQESRAYERAFREGRDVRENELEADAIEIRDEAKNLVDQIGDVIGTDVLSLGKVLDALSGASALDILLVLVGISFALSAVLRLVVPAFRFKRLLLNLEGAPHGETTARWHVQRSAGVYAREREVFARLEDEPLGNLQSISSRSSCSGSRFPSRSASS